MQTFSTNEICELCQVSRKQLRYYEEKGLLSQVPRHSGNNYRYYTHEHIYEIVAAKAMRDIDMPLGEMKDIIYGRNVASIQNSLQQQMDSAKARIPSPNNSAIQEIWSETVTSIFVDGADVAQALHDAAARIDEQLS